MGPEDPNGGAHRGCRQREQKEEHFRGGSQICVEVNVPKKSAEFTVTLVANERTVFFFAMVRHRGFEPAVCLEAV